MVSSVFGACDQSIFESMSLLAAKHKAINLGQGFPEGLEPPELIEAAISALRQGPHQYPPMMGLASLRRAVAENAQRVFGLAVDWEKEVLVTSGATEALCDAFLGLLNPGDEVIVFEPVYDSYGPIIRRAWPSQFRCGLSRRIGTFRVKNCGKPSGRASALLWSTRR